MSLSASQGFGGPGKRPKSAISRHTLAGRLNGSFRASKPFAEIRALARSGPKGTFEPSATTCALSGRVSDLRRIGICDGLGFQLCALMRAGWLAGCVAGILA